MFHRHNRKPLWYATLVLIAFGMIVLFIVAKTAVDCHSSTRQQEKTYRNNALHLQSFSFIKKFGGLVEPERQISCLSLSRMDDTTPETFLRLDEAFLALDASIVRELEAAGYQVQPELKNNSNVSGAAHELTRRARSNHHYIEIKYRLGQRVDCRGACPNEFEDGRLFEQSRVSELSASVISIGDH